MNNSIIHSNNKNQAIKICIRLQPLLPHEDIEYWNVDQETNTINSLNALPTNTTSTKQITDLNKLLMDSIYTPQSFKLDRIYQKTSHSELIYQENCSEITQKVMQGFNGSIFTYGQTTSGKTFTMLGTRNEPGILPCALKHIFELIEHYKESIQYRVYCSYIEIYNENIYDLINNNNNNSTTNAQTCLKLIDDFKYGVIVSGAKRILIKSFEEGIALKDYGEERRKYRDTLINEYSSRSHTIFQLFIESSTYNDKDRDKDNSTELSLIVNKYSFLNLIDLAGSEKVHDNELSSGETGHINKSLFVLANVINKLADGKKSHIPYRDSKLTRVLSSALGGKSLICIICTISPAAVNYIQTLSSLRFASRAKVIMLQPKVKEYYEKRKLESYENELKQLQKELKKNADGMPSRNDYYCDNNSNSNHITPMNSLIYEDFKFKYENELIRNNILQKENEKLKEAIKSNSGMSKDNEVSFLDNFIYQINEALKQTQLDCEYINYCYNELIKVNNEYKSQLTDLQDLYLKKIQDFHQQIVNRIKLIGESSMSNNENINIKKQLDKGVVFQHIRLDLDAYLTNNNQQCFSIDIRIKELKAIYEERVDLLEKKYIESKTDIKHYYKNYIKETDESKEEDKDKEIIKANIMNELNTQLALLTKLYNSKQGILEKNFFAVLRQMTTKKK